MEENKLKDYHKAYFKAAMLKKEIERKQAEDFEKLEAERARQAEELRK
jgi:hypothetical protein